MGSYTRSMAATPSRHPPPTASVSVSAPFFKLPPELRCLIYKHLLSPAALCHEVPAEECHGGLESEGEGFRRYSFADYIALQLTSRLVRAESASVFRNCNHFVRISTPWPEAQAHVAHEGRVPMILMDDRARAFEGWSMAAMIDAPLLRDPGLMGEDGEGEAMQAAIPPRDESIFVVHVQDVLDFTRMWYYSDLSHPGLNMHLSLNLLLRSPWSAAPPPDDSMDVDMGGSVGEAEASSSNTSNTTALPRIVQKQFLEPFGRIKGLASVHVEGEYEPAIYDNMMSTMQIPYDTPEHCLDQAAKRCEEGDTALTKRKDYAGAIELYFDAFEHLHIRCEGRRRSIYGDAWFVKTLESGQFEGQQGHLVRLVMRVRLVAGVVHSYLGLQEWSMARYWGMRSIRLMREANGEEDGEAADDAILTFPGAEAVGMIYLGTAIAARELRDRDEARRFAKVAARYIPNNEEVRRLRKDLQLKRVGGYGWI